ncbi:MAG: hypothetical protein H7240_05135 [Glaciimonas sp.]|nr:hypothetical protein [Glaciimonas sp.]
MKGIFVKNIKIAILGCLSFACVTANAGVECLERVTRVILHSNGGVYFMVDTTCTTTWCQINWGTAEKNKLAFSMLLTAKVTGKPLKFYWPNGLCQTYSNQTPYLSPDYFALE